MHTVGVKRQKRINKYYVDNGLLVITKIINEDQLCLNFSQTK